LWQAELHLALKCPATETMVPAPSVIDLRLVTIDFERSLIEVLFLGVQFPEFLALPCVPVVASAQAIWDIQQGK